MRNYPSAFREKTFHFFSCPTGVRSPGLGCLDRQATACCRGHRGGVWCAEIAEVKAIRKLSKEAGWWPEREELRVSVSTQSGHSIWADKGCDSLTSTEVIFL